MIADRPQAGAGQRERGWAIAAFLGGLVLAPIVATLLGRITPDSWPLWTPMVAVGLVGAALAVRAGRSRWAGLGAIFGTIAFAALLIWLFGQFDGLSEM